MSEEGRSPASVVLIHYQAHGNGHAGHWLGLGSAVDTAGGPAGIAASVPVLAWSGASGGVVADVWDCETEEVAGALLAKFRRQGSRKRLCSICSPGNARGAGRGGWERQRG